MSRSGRDRRRASTSLSGLARRPHPLPSTRSSKHVGTESIRHESRIVENRIVSAPDGLRPHHRGRGCHPTAAATDCSVSLRGTEENL